MGNKAPNIDQQHVCNLRAQLGALIYQVQQAQAVTDESLAEQIGVSRSTIRRVHRGKYFEANIDLYLKIAVVLGLKLTFN